MVKRITFNDKLWQAQADAETLAAYQEIMNDSKRRDAAIKAATKKAADLDKRAKAMKMAAGGKLKKK